MEQTVKHYAPSSSPRRTEMHFQTCFCASLCLCFCLLGVFPSHFMFLLFCGLQPSLTPFVSLFLSHTDTSSCCCCCIAVGCKYWVPAELDWAAPCDTVFVFLHLTPDLLSACKERKRSVKFGKRDKNSHSVSSLCDTEVALIKFSIKTEDTCLFIVHLLTLFSFFF